MVNFKYFNNSYNIIYNIIPIFAQKTMKTNNFYQMEYSDLVNEAIWYETNGVYSVAAQAYERLMSMGMLGRLSYLRLVSIYIGKYDILNALRVLGRYKTIYV